MFVFAFYFWHVNNVFVNLLFDIRCLGKTPYGVMAKVLDSGLEVSEFDFQSYYWTFGLITIDKGMSPLMPSQQWIKEYHCLWHYMGGAPGRRSLRLFWRETQTKGLNSRSPARPEVEEERKVQRRQAWVDKGTQREQSTTESRGRTISRRRQWGKTVKNELGFLVAL